MTREALPIEWAEAKMNLASAYRNRIRGDRVNNIEEAIRCYDQVLEVITRETLPLEWATTRMNLASAYTDRIRGDRTENMEKAIRCYDDQCLFLWQSFPSRLKPGKSCQCRSKNK